MSDKPKSEVERTIFDPNVATRRYADNIVLEPTVPAGPAQPAQETPPRAAANDPRRAIPSKPAAASVTLPVGFRLF
jgi:hypothetical protein